MKLLKPIIDVLSLKVKILLSKMSKNKFVQKSSTSNAESLFIEIKSKVNIGGQVHRNVQS